MSAGITKKSRRRTPSDYIHNWLHLPRLINHLVALKKQKKSYKLVDIQTQMLNIDNSRLNVLACAFYPAEHPKLKNLQLDFLAPKVLESSPDEALH